MLSFEFADERGVADRGRGFERLDGARQRLAFLVIDSFTNAGVAADSQRARPANRRPRSAEAATTVRSPR